MLLAEPGLAVGIEPLVQIALAVVVASVKALLFKDWVVGHIRLRAVHAAQFHNVPGQQGGAAVAGMVLGGHQEEKAAFRFQHHAADPQFPQLHKQASFPQMSRLQ